MKDVFAGKITRKMMGQEFKEVPFKLLEVEEIKSGTVLKLTDSTGTLKAFYRGVLDLAALASLTYKQSRKAVAVSGWFCAYSNAQKEGFYSGDRGLPVMYVSDICESEVVPGVECGISDTDMVEIAGRLKGYIERLNPECEALVKGVMNNHICKRMLSAPMTISKGFSYNGGVMTWVLESISRIFLEKKLEVEYKRYENNTYTYPAVDYDLIITAVILAGVLKSLVYTPKPEAKKVESVIMAGTMVSKADIVNKIIRSQLTEFQQNNLIGMLNLDDSSHYQHLQPATQEAVLFLAITNLVYNRDKWCCYAQRLREEAKISGYIDGMYTVLEPGTEQKEGDEEDE